MKPSTRVPRVEDYQTALLPISLTVHLEARNIQRALAVVAHPDDESFGLGALLSALIDQDIEVGIVCFTHGEASTLGEEVEDLAVVRAAELHEAADQLGIAAVTLLNYRDGTLQEVATGRLADEVDNRMDSVDLLIVFEPCGVTGHPDHRAATAAATCVAIRHRLPMLEWGLSHEVAHQLNAEFGASFTSFGEDPAVTTLQVNRTRQARAIESHRSQGTDNAVLARRLALQGDTELARWRLPLQEDEEETQ